MAHGARVPDDRSAIQAVATVRDGRDVELLEDAWALAFGALSDDDEHGHANMSLYCNEDRVCPHKMLNSTEPYSCWGTFKLFGKYVDEDDHVRAMWGGKCEGNLRAFRAPGKAIISVCSGLMKQFGARAIHHDDDGSDDDHHRPEMAAVHGSGCNGKHVFGMVRDEDGGDDDDDRSPLALHEALAAGGDAVVMRDARIEQALREVSSGDGHGPGRIEDSCDGKGGMFKGVVEVPRCRHARAAVAAIADVDGLEGMVNMSMLSMGVSLFQGAHPSHPPPPPHGDRALHNDHHNHDKNEEHHDHHDHHDHEEHHSHHDDHHSNSLQKLFHMGDHHAPQAPPPPPVCAPPRMHCYETCNGHQPWVKGLPCWGKFEVLCSGFKAEEAAGKVEEAAENDACGPKEVYASCEGFYSGFFGMSCRGFASKHIVGDGKDMRAFCSGKDAVLIIRPSIFFRTRGHGFAAFCDGSALSTVAFEGDRTRRAAVAA